MKTFSISAGGTKPVAQEAIEEQSRGTALTQPQVGALKALIDALPGDRASFICSGTNEEDGTAGEISIKATSWTSPQPAEATSTESAA